MHFTVLLLYCFSAELWAKAIHRPDLEHMAHTAPGYLHRNGVVCSQHFHETAFLNDLHNRLQPSAIPTLNVPGSTTAQRSEAEICLPPCKRMKVTSHSLCCSGWFTTLNIIYMQFTNQLPKSESQLLHF